MQQHALNRIESFPDEAEAFHLHTPLNILLVEDEASDSMLAEIALDDANIAYEIHTLQDGQEVLPYLHRQGKYRCVIKPDVLVLDLSLPTKDGFEVLTDLAEQSEQFGDLSIIILTADSHCTFLKKSYALNIIAYITKPCTAHKIHATMTSVQKR